MGQNPRKVVDCEIFSVCAISEVSLEELVSFDHHQRHSWQFCDVLVTCNWQNPPSFQPPLSTHLEHENPRSQLKCWELFGWLHLNESSTKDYRMFNLGETNKTISRWWKSQLVTQCLCVSRCSCIQSVAVYKFHPQTDQPAELTRMYSFHIHSGFLSKARWWTTFQECDTPFAMKNCRKWEEAGLHYFIFWWSFADVCITTIFFFVGDVLIRVGVQHVCQQFRYMVFCCHWSTAVQKHHAIVFYLGACDGHEAEQVCNRQNMLR